jgi:hypothetical protein
MSRLRHKEEKRAKGGGVKETVYAGEGSNVLKEAEERKRGGKITMHGEGEAAKMRADRPKRARGGVVARATGGAVKGRAKGGRIRGEGVGADRTPLSSAAKIKEIEPGEIGEDEEKSD